MKKQQAICPVCTRAVDVDRSAHPDDIDEALKPLLAVNAFGREPGKEICLDCLLRFSRVRDELDSAFPNFAKQEVKILPTPLRLDAPALWRGRGVTMAFIDAGFYAHPDLTEPRNRLLKYVNLVGDTRLEDLRMPQVSSWHGMMTSVVAAGNGFMAKGVYRVIGLIVNVD